MSVLDRRPQVALCPQRHAAPDLREGGHLLERRGAPADRFVEEHQSLARFDPLALPGLHLPQVPRLGITLDRGDQQHVNPAELGRVEILDVGDLFVALLFEGHLHPLEAAALGVLAGYGVNVDADA